MFFCFLLTSLCQNYFFWTWKIGPSAVSGQVESPGVVLMLPSYTSTGSIITLPGPTFTSSSGSPATTTINVGNGWENAADNQGLFTPIPTCTYLDPWVSPGTPAPSPLCAAAARREESSITPTPAPAPAL